jgi:hypothetical protein
VCFAKSSKAKPKKSSQEPPEVLYDTVPNCGRRKMIIFGLAAKKNSRDIFVASSSNLAAPDLVGHISQTTK